MPAPKLHFYRLAGESLHALNRLIEFDRIKTDWQLESFKQQIRRENGTAAPAPKTDTALPARSAMQDFSAAQIKAYQKALGFHDLPVQVRDYANGTIYRAYQVLPKFLMNPGTSKMYFGLADLLRAPDKKPQERVAFCICYEDYKGNHFAPAGAQKLTDDEFYAHAAIEDQFEHYREYDQGVKLPADFDPDKHLTVPYMSKKDFHTCRATHHFILQDAAQKEIAAYDRAHHDWQMKFQDFRFNFEKLLHPLLFGGAPAPVSVWVENTRAPKEDLLLSLHMPRGYFEEHRGKLECACEIVDIREQPHGMLLAELRPRPDDPVGKHLADVLTTVPVAPEKPASYDALPGGVLENKITFDGNILGFPYMKIERPQDPDTRILAFRLPPNVGTVEAPNADCKPLSLDEYAALSGAEAYFDGNDLPRHAFLIGGDTLVALQKFEKDHDDWQRKHDAFRAQVEAVFHQNAPGCVLESFDLAQYQIVGKPRDLRIEVGEKEYQLSKGALQQAGLEELYPSSPRNGLRHLWLSTREGSALRATLDQVPLAVYFPSELGRTLGFFTNHGYSLMCTEDLRGTQQKAVLYVFPPYIKDVTPPPGAQALDKESFLHFMIDSFDVNSGTVPPPRPTHIKGLPTAEGPGLDRARKMRDGLKQEGFPLGPRSDSGWFQKPGT